MLELAPELLYLVVALLLGLDLTWTAGLALADVVPEEVEHL